MQEDQSNQIIITDHAYDRANERLSLTKDSFARLAMKAFELGITHADAKGRLRKYMDSLWFKYKSANNVKIYGENLFFFKDNLLITTYQIPHELKKFLKISKK